MSPENPLTERQHRAIRVALVAGLVGALVFVPLAVLCGMRALDAFEAPTSIAAGLAGVAWIIGGLLWTSLACAAAIFVRKVLRSYRAHRRAPVERCPARVVGVRMGGPKSAPSAWVTLEFEGGERREYLTSRVTCDALDEDGRGQAVLRGNHLLEFVPEGA